MHSNLKPRSEWTREEIVGFHLGTLALHIDPKLGQLVKVAEALEVHPNTLGRWKSQGFVPFHQVKRLQKRYGKKLVPEDELCPVEFRASY